MEIGYPCSNATVDVGSDFHKKKDGPKTCNSRNPILKCKEEQVEDDGTVDASETSEDTETLETSEETFEDDDAIEILDADTFHKNVCRKINFDECEGLVMEKLRNRKNKVDEGKQCSSQSVRSRFSFRTMSNKTTEVASSRFHKLAGTSSNCNHLLQCKKEPFESKGKEKQLSHDENNRRQMKHKSVLWSGNVNSKLNPHCQDKRNAGQFVGGSNRSRVTRDRSEEFCGASDKIAELIVSDGGSSRMRINNESVYPYPCKKFRSSQELGLPVFYSGKTRGLVDSCETNEVRNRGDETSNNNVKKEVLEMDVHSFEKIPSELTELRKANLAKFVTTKSVVSGIQINGSIKRSGQNSDSFKHGLQSQESPVPLLNQNSIPGNIPMTIKVEAEDIMVSPASTSRNACFQVTMRRSYVNEKFRLYVPLRLASVLKHNSEGVVLQLPDGRRWRVKLKCYKPSYIQLNHGWKDFVLDNGLKEGDVCLFRVVEKEPDVIKVVILRST
ncbi:hypothetical protein Sjap_010147 [Stephania japonica]|uniref:TF-B3 domain-containing protein n=1 Tax=Stephania japonica TaxID=461633 RepID=A0AAP0JAN3_9MAGN